MLNWNLHLFQLLDVIHVLDSISWVRCASGNVLTSPLQLNRMHFHFSLSIFFASILTFFQMFSSGHFLPFHQLHKYCLLSLSILQSRSPLPPIHAHSHSVLI